MPGVAPWRGLDTDAILDRLARISALVGSPDEVIRQIRAFEAAGVTEISLQWFAPDDIEGLEMLAAEVLPRVGLSPYVIARTITNAKAIRAAIAFRSALAAGFPCSTLRHSASGSLLAPIGAVGVGNRLIAVPDSRRIRGGSDVKVPDQASAPVLISATASSNRRFTTNAQLPEDTLKARAHGQRCRIGEQWCSNEISPAAPVV